MDQRSQWGLKDFQSWDARESELERWEVMVIELAA